MTQDFGEKATAAGSERAPALPQPPAPFPLPPSALQPPGCFSWAPSCNSKCPRASPGGSRASRLAGAAITESLAPFPAALSWAALAWSRGLQSPQRASARGPDIASPQASPLRWNGGAWTLASSPSQFIFISLFFNLSVPASLFSNHSEVCRVSGTLEF